MSSREEERIIVEKKRQERSISYCLLDSKFYEEKGGGKSTE
jgi:hypothetical protein